MYIYIYIYIYIYEPRKATVERRNDSAQVQTNVFFTSKLQKKTSGTCAPGRLKDAVTLGNQFLHFRNARLGLPLDAQVFLKKKRGKSLC